MKILENKTIVFAQSTKPNQKKLFSLSHLILKGT